MYTFLTNANAFVLVLEKNLTDSLMLHTNIFPKVVFLFIHPPRFHLTPFYPEELLHYPHLQNFMPFSVSMTFETTKHFQYANSDKLHFHSDDTLSTLPDYTNSSHSQADSGASTPSNYIKPDTSLTDRSSFKQTTRTHSLLRP